MRRKFYSWIACIVIIYSANAQNVGIGTSTPAFKLDVQGRMRVKTGTLGNVNTSSGIWFEDYRNGNNQFFFGMKDSIRGGFYGSGTGWNLLFNTKTGHFNGSFSMNGAIDLHNGTTGHLGGTINTDSNDVYINARKANAANTKGNLVMQFTDPRNPSLQAGNVGIGVDTPYYKLSVNGSVGLYSGTAFTGSFQNSGDNLLINAALGQIGSPSRDIILQTALFPFSAGQVGIGTSNPTEKLDVNGNMNVSGNVKLSGSISVGDEINRTATGTNDLLPVAFGKIFGDGTIHTGTGNFTVTKTGTGKYDLQINGIGPASATLILTTRGNAVFIRTITYDTDGSPAFHIYSYRMENVYDSQGNLYLVRPTPYDGDFNFVAFYF